MSIIDFKEIAQANRSTGKQDDFELFSRDFFEYLGYRIIAEPDRGQDGGIDILVEEIRSGISGETKLQWLVSCKHYAHSGKSVGTDDEVNIGDRVDSNDCDGFIGFYSTIASSGLTSKLKGLFKKHKKEFQVFDRGKIEKFLLEKQEGIILAKRYFPVSMKAWEELDFTKNVEDEKRLIRQKSYEDYLRRKKSEKY